MSFAAYKTMHPPTGIWNCASGFITHSCIDSLNRSIPQTISSDELDPSWHRNRNALGPVPNLVVTSANILEVYEVRVQNDGSSNRVVDGVSAASLELVCAHRLHGNVESIVVLPREGNDSSRKRDSIILTFKDAKMSVLEFDDSTQQLRTSSMHCFEGPEWLHLRRGKESFEVGPVVKVDPQGRCGGVLVYDSQMIILKALHVGSSLVADDDVLGFSGYNAARITSSYIINLWELEIKHLKDFVFIHDYIEPVMVILHESELTWSGRLPWKHHTCIISAFSISTTSKQPTLIWSVGNLPHDAHYLLSVPSPIGGVLVICTNSIHYHRESASSSLAVNSYASSLDSSSEFPMSSFSTELDSSNATWLLNDVALISTKSGELLLLTLIYDGRVVQRLDISRSKASVLTSGITTLGGSLFFLASRLGDSLLVQYTSGSLASASVGSKDEAGDIDVDGLPLKRMRRSSSDALHDLSNVDELSLYATSTNNTESSQKSFSFVVRDSFYNVAPLKDFAYGLRSNADPNAVGIAKQSNYELVCCSGHGKNGSLCVLQQSVRPDVITDVELVGCKGIWTVYHKNVRVAAADDEYHAYLIISMESRTMVLETADLLSEVTENVDYFVQGRTIAAGNLFGRRRVVQVFDRGARILDGSFMTQDIKDLSHASSESVPISDTTTVLSAMITDPYVLLRMSDGSIRLLVGDPSTCTVSVKTPPMFETPKNSVSSCTLYHERASEPWLRMTSTDAWLSNIVGETIDGVDGGSQDNGAVYCVLCYDGGSLEIFDIPNFNSVYFVDNFLSGKSLLTDINVKIPHKELQKPPNVNVEGRKVFYHDIKIVEVAMYKWPGRHTRPFLFAVLSDGTLLCYHAFMFDDSSSKFEPNTSHSAGINGTSASRLRNLRFSRIQLDAYGKEETSNNEPTQRINYFNNISGHQGFFLCGSRPSWFMLFRDRFRVHPQLCDGSVVAFTVLHNVNCNHGFIYVTSQGNMKICQLPSAPSYDNHWPVQKIPLRATPHQVAYVAERSLYAIIVSTPSRKPASQVLSWLDQEGGHTIEHGNMIAEDLHQTLSVEDFEIRILEPEKSGGPWKAKTALPLQINENGLTIRMVTLLNITTKENETLLAVGTAFTNGEDVAARGRVILFSFSKESDDSKPLVTEVYSKEFKGSISALASLQGQLLVASGPKIVLHKWTGQELTAVAFSDAPPLYVVSLNIVKNFILLGDVQKSVYFLSWKEQGAQLSLLAKDFASVDCSATEFLIDGSTLSLVVSDEQKNVQIMYYAPKMSESWKGQKLLSRAEFHLGAQVSKFLRLQMISAAEKTNRFALVLGTVDGCIGCIAPLDELAFRRLQSLQKKLVDCVAHVAGLNPRSFRHFRSPGKPHRPGPETILDFELLLCYDMLELEEQLEIAHQIGTTRSQIISSFNDFYLGISFL